MNAILLNPIYDLANRHFKVEITDRQNRVRQGSFVQFKVVDKEYEFVYPAGKYCFLPEEHKSAFWKKYHENRGEFKKFPEEVQQLSMSEISQIRIKPQLVY